jgi:ribonuclease BN (tRNA processing enzyme)
MHMKLIALGISGGFPAPGGATSGYLLQFQEKNILIDCGSGVLSNLFRFIPVESLDAVILTHLHHDHTSDIHVLRYAVDLSRRFDRPVKPIPVFAPASPEPLASNLQSDGNLIVGQVIHGTELNMFGATVRFFAMDHPIESYGIAIELAGRKIVYTGDTIPCANLKELLQQADLAVMDAGSLERFRKPVMMHTTAAECATLAAEAGVKRLILSHLLPLFDEQEILNEAKIYFPEAELAKIGEAYIV